jgi:hypothetical protein
MYVCLNPPPRQHHATMGHMYRFVFFIFIFWYKLKHYVKTKDVLFRLRMVQNYLKIGMVKAIQTQNAAKLLLFICFSDEVPCLLSNQAAVSLWLNG